LIVKKVNVFTDMITGGNPAGVCLDKTDLNEKQMSFVSKILSVSETAYVFPSEIADYKVRFFTPTIEVDLCGHATIATFYLLAKEGFIKDTKNIVTLKQETNVGILPIDIYYKNGCVDKVMMTQSKPKLKDVYINWNKIADSLNIKKSDIDSSLPKQIVSTGLFTLPICIKSFEILSLIKPNFEEIKKICISLNVGSFHLFTFDTLDKKSVYHARNFPPLYGVDEDPVTGTANGAVCSYLYLNNIVTQNKFICEQGDIIGRSGRVFVSFNNNVIKVGGKAKIVDELEIDIG